MKYIPLILLSLFISAELVLSEPVLEDVVGLAADAVIKTELAADPLTYRYNHPSSLCENREGKLVVAWVGGFAEGSSQLRSAYETANGWSSEQVIESNFCFDPVLFQPSAPDAPLLLFYHRGRYVWDWKGYVRKSTDNGITWSDATLLPLVNDKHHAYSHSLTYRNLDGGPHWTNYWKSYNYRHVPPEQNPPLELPNGDLLCSAGKQFIIETGNVACYSHVFTIPANNYTGDNPDGDPWINIRYVPPDSIEEELGEHGLEPLNGSFLVLDNNVADSSYDSIGLVLRKDVDGGVLMSYSYDAGDSWSMPEPIITRELYGKDQSPAAGNSALSLDINGGIGKGWHLIAGAFKGRTYIRIISSKDGYRWLINTLDIRYYSTADSKANKEQADPTLIQTSDGNIHMLYTGRGCASLRHVILDKDILLEKLEPAWVAKYGG